MMESQHNNLSAASQTSAGLKHDEEDRKTLRPKPMGLTITTEKIDRILADVQSEIERLLRERADLGLVRSQLATMDSRWRGA